MCACLWAPPPSPLHHHLLSSEWAANLPAFTPLFSPCADWEIKQWLFESGPDTDTHSLICIKNKWRCYSPNDSITITNALSVSARVSSSCWVMLRVVMHMRFQPGRLQFCTGTLLLHSSTFNKLAAFCLQNICFTVYIRTTQTAAQNAELVRASSIVFISEHPYCKLRKLCFILPHVDKQWDKAHRSQPSATHRAALSCRVTVAKSWFGPEKSSDSTCFSLQPQTDRTHTLNPSAALLLSALWLPHCRGGAVDGHPNQVYLVGKIQYVKEKATWLVPLFLHMKLSSFLKSTNQPVKH